MRESSAALWMPHVGKGTWVHREALRRPGGHLLFQSRSSFQWPLGEEGKCPQIGYNDLVVSSGTEFIFLGDLNCFPRIGSPTLLSRVTHFSALSLDLPFLTLGWLSKHNFVPNWQSSFETPQCVQESRRGAERSLGNLTCRFSFLCLLLFSL